MARTQTNASTAWKIDAKRWKQIQAMQLRYGTGKKLEEKLCVMQAVDYVTTGGFSDQPECACPVLTSYAIRLNDRLSESARQRLKPLIPKLIGTRDSLSEERREVLLKNSINVVLPLLVEAAGLKDEAETLRTLDTKDRDLLRDYCTGLRPKLRQAMLDTAKKEGWRWWAAAAADADAAAAAAAADADAAAAAAAAADAADAAAADAAAADAAAAAVPRWRSVRDRILDASLEGLEKACAIRDPKVKAATVKKARR